MNVATTPRVGNHVDERTESKNLRGRVGAAFSPNNPKRKRHILFALAALCAIIAIGWMIWAGRGLPAGFAGGNGRLEANEVYIASKYAGRIKEVLADEGDTVEAGQVVARMDTDTLEAQLRQALAREREAQSAREVAVAQIAVKDADYKFAAQQYQRSKQLVPGGSISEQEAQLDAARSLGARAELTGARSRVVEAQSNIEAAHAEVERLRAEIDDSVLKAPIRARVETRLAEPGEVLAAGGRVLSLIDLSDVYMYVFLPDRDAGRVALGSEARLVLDAAPDYPIAANVSFVSPMAQFTPKAVETAEERHNLTFRVKLQIPRERLQQFEPLVKAGMPGMGYVRLDNSAQWPTDLVGGRALPANVWSPTGAAKEPASPTSTQQPASGKAGDRR